MRNYHERLDKRMFDFPEFYSQMANQLPDGSTIAEVGVAEGASAIYLAETLLNLNKSFTFYLIDDLSYGRDSQLRILMKNVGDANLGSFVEIIPLPSVEAACQFPDNHFDFVFIDASHKFEWTKADILLWYQKVKDGSGILAGHDYADNPQVKEAVDLTIPKKVVTKVCEVEGEKIIHTQKSLEIIQTEEGHGIWKVQKQHHVKLQTY